MKHARTLWILIGLVPAVWFALPGGQALGALPDPNPPHAKPKFPCDNMPMQDCLACCFQQGSIAEVACNFILGSDHETYCSNLAERLVDSCVDEDC